MGCLVGCFLAVLLIALFPICVILGPIGWIAFFVLLGAAIQCAGVVSGRG